MAADRLYCTQLDDVDSYKDAQKKTIDTFKYGRRLQLIVEPLSKEDYLNNFRISCKYGLNKFIESYLEEFNSDYAKLLNDLFVANSMKNSSNNNIWDRSIINIIIDYLPPYSWNAVDLLQHANRYNETGMVSAAKYGQIETLKILIKYSKINGVLDETINHEANGGTPIHWLFKSFGTKSFQYLDENRLIQPAMIMLLQNGASCKYRDRNGDNVIDVAVERNKKIEARIMICYSETRGGRAKSPMEYAKQTNDNEVISILKCYGVDEEMVEEDQSSCCIIL